jgi:predicted TIM-barrel fold metal-dependent hydrolase
MTKRKIVDAHHHLWDLTRGYNYPWLQDPPSGEGLLGDIDAIRVDYLPNDYLADVRNYDLVGSVHVEAVPADPAAESAWLGSVAAHPGLAQSVVARVELQKPDAERAIAEHRRFPRVRGIRQIVNWHADPKLTFTDHDLLTDEAWRRGFALLRKYGLSFDLQLFPGQMQSAAELAARNPDTLIIVNHTGMPIGRDAEAVAAWRRGMKLLAARPNVSAKISGLGMVDWRWTPDSIRPFVLETIDVFGVDRAMFGSNFPVDKLYSSFDALYGAFEAIVGDFSANEQDKLFRANAVRIYRVLEGTGAR